MVFASDLDRQWNDFPLHPSFVPFAVELIRHAAGPPEGSRFHLVHEAPPGIPSAPGVYQAPDGARLVAVNVDPRESPLSRMRPADFQGLLDVGPAPEREPGPRPADEAEREQNLWRYGLVLMLAALLVESAVGRARSGGRAGVPARSGERRVA